MNAPMGLAQRLFALVVVVAAASGFAGVARTTTITGYESGSGAAVSAQPTFAISATDQNSGDHPFTIRATADPPTVGGELREGYSLTISVSGGSVQLPASLGPAIPFAVAPAPSPPAPTASTNSPPASTSATSAPATSSPAPTPVTSSPSTLLPASKPPAARRPTSPTPRSTPASRPRSDKKDP